jgi:hypothetical protein
MSHSIGQIKLSFKHLKASLMVIASLAVSVSLWSYSLGGVKGLMPAAVGQGFGEFKIEISPATPTNITPISIEISGTWPSSCVPHKPQVSIIDKQIHITTTPSGNNCQDVFASWYHSLDIGTLPVGTYEVVVTHIFSEGPMVLGSKVFEVFPCFNCQTAELALPVQFGRLEY